jgi:hypothetical protein
MHTREKKCAPLSLLFNGQTERVCGKYYAVSKSIGDHGMNSALAGFAIYDELKTLQSSWYACGSSFKRIQTTLMS